MSETIKWTAVTNLSLNFDGTHKVTIGVECDQKIVNETLESDSFFLVESYLHVMAAGLAFIVKAGAKGDAEGQARYLKIIYEKVEDWMSVNLVNGGADETIHQRGSPG